MNGSQELYLILEKLRISFQYIEHPPAPTIEIAKAFWQDFDSTHCKNIFLRNHKGNKHYLVILECNQNVDIKELEQRLKQGKLSFASEQRLEKYLGVKPGSVTPFGLINDKEHHVHLFLDARLADAGQLSFHPNINTASLIVGKDDFFKFLNYVGNTYEFIDLTI